MFFPCIFPCKLTLRFSQERVLKLKSWRKQTSLKIQFYSNNCLKQDKNPKKLHMTRSTHHAKVRMKYKIFPVKIFYFEHCPPFTCAFIPHAISARSQVVGGRKWKIIGGGKWNHIRRGRFQWKGMGTSLVKTGALLDLVLWSCFLVSKLLGVPFWWCTIGTSGP